MKNMLSKKKNGLCLALALLLAAAQGSSSLAAGSQSLPGENFRKISTGEEKIPGEKLTCIKESSAISPKGKPAGETEEEERLLAPYFVVNSEDSDVDTFPLKSTHVTVNINGIIAETYVVQTYTNEGSTPISARYVFPTSSDVSVHGMNMQIGNQIVTARIKEKEEARAEFTEAKSEGKSASLLEQKRPNVFTMDVANIMPGDTACIELHYTQLITPAEGTYEFIFPTVTGPRYIPLQSSENSQDRDDQWAASPYLEEGVLPPGEYHITVNLSTGVPLTEISCKSHEINVSKDGDSQARITLANPEEYAGNRDFILKYKLTGQEVHSGLVLARQEEKSTGAPDGENFFMLTIQPPERFEPEDIPPREYIFVLDVSGSMYGYPLDTAKDLIRDLVSSLRMTDTFNLILFADNPIPLSRKSLPATSENVKEALDLINREEGGGGTSILPAVREAIAIPEQEDTARSIVIITDGYVSNETEIFDVINANMDSADFFSFGIGSSVNDYLIKGIAQSGLGESFIVTDSQDAADAAERFCTYIGSPLLTDIKIDYDDFEVYDVEPSTPSILYAQKPIVLFGKWKGEPGGTITVTGKTGGEDYVQEISINDTSVDTESEALRYLWARTRLDKLAGYGSVRNDSSVKEEITQIGLAYSMTTPYTSFIAVIDTVRNAGGESTHVDQAQPLPLQVSNLAVGGGYSAYSEPGELLLLLAAAAVPLLALLRRKAQQRGAAKEQGACP